MKKAVIVILGVVVLAGAPFGAYKLGLLDRLFGTGAADTPSQSSPRAGSSAPDTGTPGNPEASKAGAMKKKLNDKASAIFRADPRDM